MKEMMEMNCLKNMNQIYKNNLLINLLNLFPNLGSTDPRHQDEDLVIRKTPEFFTCVFN